MNAMAGGSFQRTPIQMIPSRKLLKNVLLKTWSVNGTDKKEEINTAMCCVHILCSHIPHDFFSIIGYQLVQSSALVNKSMLLFISMH